MPHLLLVEDDLTFSTMLATWLRKQGFDVTTASLVSAAVKALTAGSGGKGAAAPDLVLSDLRLPDHDGLYLLEWLHREGFTAPFIIMTSYAEVGNAVEAMKRGAADYIAKPVQPDMLLTKIREALANGEKGTRPVTPQATKEGKRPAQPGPSAAPPHHAAPAPDSSQPKGIEGHSPAARELYKLASLVAPTPMSVLILGASGTGKEYVARRIHEQSRRSNGPFVALDCGALTRELAASELFGHVKGAFTGAATDKVGAFERASGGTLFLDEVGNLSYDVQVQLLRALQERLVRRVGDAVERPVDIRLVSATNEDLPAAIARGAWREDLYHRLAEFTLHMPLLRERRNDIAEFAAYFLDRANAELGSHIEGFTPEALELLRAYPWPGNLREMRNVITRAALLSQQTAFITPAALNLPTASTALAERASIAPLKPAPEDERARVLEALRLAGGNKSRAAQLLGVDRKTIYNRMKALGI